MRPRRPQERPKRAQDGPKSRQERPKSRPRGANKEQKRSPSSVGLSGWPPGGLREPFWLDFGGSGEHFQTIFGDVSKQVGTEASARNAPSSKRPAQAAQRPSKGIERSTPLAILMLALLSPRLLCCSSWPCALVSLVVLASLLVFCVVCNACGSRVERASRSMIARFSRYV